jgi:hypothetical protein
MSERNPPIAAETTKEVWKFDTDTHALAEPAHPSKNSPSQPKATDQIRENRTMRLVCEERAGMPSDFLRKYADTGATALLHTSASAIAIKKVLPGSISRFFNQLDANRPTRAIPNALPIQKGRPRTTLVLNETDMLIR